MQNDYLEIRRAMYHSVFAEEEKARRKAALKNINRDFFQDLPSQVCGMLDELCWTYKDQPWFEEAWEKYRKHVLDAGLGGKIKMPGFVFNEYIDRYVDEQEKKMKKELVHMDTCDIEELYHHGVKGQKWGMRRWQNEDGTLTEAGKQRYLKTEVVSYRAEDGKKHWKKQTTFDKKQYEKDVGDSESSQMELFNQAKNLTSNTADLARERRRGSKVINDKDYSKLSDEELRKKVNRMSLERQYAELNGDNKYVMTGREKVNEVLRDIGDIIGVVGGVASMALIVKHLRSNN